MIRQPLNSSSLASAGYDPMTQTLEIEFCSGRIYQYTDVPTDVYDALLSAESAGRYFAAVIRHGPYPAQELTP